MRITARGFRAFAVTADVAFDAEGAIPAIEARVAAVAEDPAVLARVLYHAVAESFLHHLRERFVANLPRAMEMEREDPARGPVTVARARGTAEGRGLAKAHRRLSAAIQSGDAARVTAAEARVADAETAMRDALNRSPAGERIRPSSLSSGLFRPLALQLLRVMTDPARLVVTRTADAITVSAADRRVLEEFRTPSATEHVLGLHPTTSRYDVLWRHLEFGTGLYATDPEGKTHPPTRYSLLGGRGAWAYSKRPPRGPVFRGQRGVHALRQASGDAYGVDQLDFDLAFGAAFGRALRGG